MTGQPVKAMPSHGQQRALLFHVWQSTMRVPLLVDDGEVGGGALGYHAEALPLLGKQRGGRRLVIFVKMSSSGTSGWFFAR